MNLFFAHSKTIEFRIHESTCNFDKILLYALVCTSILKYAENFNETLSVNSITMKQVIEDHLNPELSKKVLEYLEERKTTFSNSGGGFKGQWKTIEQVWMENDSKFTKKL